MAHDPVAPLVVVRAFDNACDPAVDWGACDQDEYRKNRQMESLVMLPGATPAKFYIRRLPATFVLGSLEGSTVGEQTMLAIRAALFRIDLASGTTIRPEKTSKVNGADLAPPEWVNTVRDKFGMATVYEMATVALRLAQLSEDERGPLG